MLAGARIRPGFARGLQLGGSVYLDRVTTESADADERIGSVHAVWDSGAPEVIAEYVHIRHEDNGVTAAGTTESHGFYVQTGYRLPGALAAFKPYGRWERLAIDGDDFMNQLAWMVGIAFERNRC